LKIDDAAELIFRTYYMMDWSKVKQSQSDQSCVTCGGRMMKAEPFTDKKGLEYDGFVCHACKTVFWLKRG
jgi:hypothetical protein